MHKQNYSVIYLTVLQDDYILAIYVTLAKKSIFYCTRSKLIYQWYRI